MQQQLQLNWDWNSTTFCATNFQHNASLQDGKKIQLHLKENTTVRKNFEHLQYQVLDTFKKEFPSDNASDIDKILVNK